VNKAPCQIPGPDAKGSLVKFEVRSSKAEGNPKSELRSCASRLFGFRISEFFRLSVFGFRYSPGPIRFLRLLPRLRRGVYPVRVSPFRNLLAGLLCLSALSSQAANTNSSWSVRAWQSDDGLPNNTVTGLAQTSDGYLWAASPGPLARFDGVKFEQFTPSQIVPGYHQNARALLQARDGSLWIALAYGPVFRLDAGGVQVFSNIQENQVVMDLIEDGDATVWVNYRGGKLSRIQKGPPSPGMTALTINHGWREAYGTASLACDTQGRLWFAKNGRIGLFRNEKFETLLDLREPPAPISLARARDGGVWINHDLRLLKYDGTGIPEDLGRIRSLQSTTDPTAMLEDRQGGVWIGTSDSGLFHFDGLSFEHVPTAHPQILSITEDREGNIWVGTGGGGLNRVQPCTVKLENTDTGLPFEAVRSICEDAGGAVWACTQNGVLVRRETNGWAVVPVGVPEIAGAATCVAPDREGGVWIGGNNRQLHHLRDGKWTSYIGANGIPPNSIHALLVSTNGDLWAGGNGPETLARLRGDKWRLFQLPPDVKYIRAMTEDSAGNIWIGTSRGFLFRVTGDSLTDETSRVLGTHLSIRALHATPDGSVWIACAGTGLGWINREGRFLLIGPEHGLPDGYLSQVVSDDRGWLWLGADRGIFKVRQRELEAVAAGQETRVQCVQYGRSAGLPSLQANFGDTPGALRTRDGRLWMPMRTALAVIHPGKGHETFDPPPVLLKQLIVDEQPVAAYGRLMPTRARVNLSSPGAVVRLPPRHHRLEFEYAALSLSAPENIHFRYRLEGFDENWVQAGTQRSVSYSRLPAGEYQFRVEARNGGGQWNAGATMSLTIAPFLWQTWWFRLGLLVTFTASVIAIVRYISFRRLHLKVRMLEQQAALDKERARIARDLHDDLGSRLTNIITLSELALQKRSDPAQAFERVTEVSTAARRVVQTLDETVWAVNPRNDTLPELINYLSQFSVEFLRTAGIRCHVDLLEYPASPAISAELRHNVFLAVKEALNNLVRHAHATEAHLRVTWSDGSIALEIEDNGKGFTNGENSSTADGLRNMRERMKEIDGRFTIETSPGTGTCVRLTFPFKNGS